MRLHNNLLRRQLRIIGGYEVKTEGDSFMVSFPTVTSAMLWCFTCQLQLINEDWPREILECDDGREVLDAYGDRIHRGLSVRMGIHWGTPVWERDPITRRMDYFGPMVNKAARINASADGGQIMASSDVLKEVQGLYDYLETEEDNQVEQLPGDVGRDVVQLRRLGLGVLDMGERKLKGLERELHGPATAVSVESADQSLRSFCSPRALVPRLPKSPRWPSRLVDPAA
jgi:adenylate cyclase